VNALTLFIKQKGTSMLNEEMKKKKMLNGENCVTVHHARKDPVQIKVC